jgi:AcrR family transcriptional regulator
MVMDTENIPAKDRRKELILIAYNHIAKRGFEGLRVRAVAAEAGINNATLHYYFPTKEDLITGVVDYMIEKFSTSNSFESAAIEFPDAWKAMHAELEDARHRFLDARDQIVVFTELLIRSLRDPAIARIFKKLDESWRGYLVSIIEQGIRQGIFRAELDPTVTATLVMLQIKGFGYHMLGETDQSITDEVFDQLAMQIESWLVGKFKN